MHVGSKRSASDAFSSPQSTLEDDDAYTIPSPISEGIVSSLADFLRSLPLGQSQRVHSFPYRKFPPLAALREYCATTPVDEISQARLASLLEGVQLEFLRYRKRKLGSFPEEVELVQQAIIGFLQMVLDRCDALSLELQKGAIDPTVKTVQELFSLQMTLLLKSIRSTQVIATDAAAAPSAAIATSKPEMKLKKAELKKAKELIQAIYEQKVDRVTALLAADPTLSTYGDRERTVFGDAAWGGNLLILQQVVSHLPADYDFGLCVGEESSAQLPAVLWAAVAGQYDAVVYLFSLPHVQSSIKLPDLRDQLNAIERLLENFEENAEGLNFFAKSPEDYRRVLSFLEGKYTELSAAPIPEMEPKGVSVNGGAGYSLAVTQAEASTAFLALKQALEKQEPKKGSGAAVATLIHSRP